MMIIVPVPVRVLTHAVQIETTGSEVSHGYIIYGV